MGDNGCKLLLKLSGIFIIETLAPLLGCTILSVLYVHVSCPSWQLEALDLLCNFALFNDDLIGTIALCKRYTAIIALRVHEHFY